MLPKIIQRVKVICREEMKNGDGVKTYVLPGDFDLSELSAIALRSRYNPELKYFAAMEEALTEEQTPIILKLLEIDGQCSVTTPIY